MSIANQDGHTQMCIMIEAAAAMSLTICQITAATQKTSHNSKGRKEYQQRLNNYHLNSSLTQCRMDGLVSH